MLFATHAPPCIDGHTPLKKAMTCNTSGVIAFLRSAIIMYSTKIGVVVALMVAVVAVAAVILQRQ